MLKPLHDNVILKKEKAEKETTTASGIILTDNAKNVPSYATVVAIGPESKADIKENDKVVYKEYSGTNVKDVYKRQGKGYQCAKSCCKCAVIG